MKLKTIILFCILQSIVGTKISSHKIKPRSISPRIRGGVDAAEGQAPFQCSLQKKSSGHYCGCAVISAEWIITAAHCLEGKSPSEVQIVVGTNQWKSGVQYAPETFIIHEGYDKPPFAYDIGLIHVQTPIEFNEKVQPIKYSSEEVPVGASLQVTGWGFFKRGGRILDSLQVLNVTLITNEECKKKSNVVHESHLCTKSPFGQGVCDGDSGGPLVYGDELVGIANFAIPCGWGRPDGFAKISYLYDWIQKNMNV